MQASDIDRLGGIDAINTFLEVCQTAQETYKGDLADILISYNRFTRQRPLDLPEWVWGDHRAYDPELEEVARMVLRELVSASVDSPQEREKLNALQGIIQTRLSQIDSARGFAGAEILFFGVVAVGIILAMRVQKYKNDGQSTEITFGDFPKGSKDFFKFCANFFKISGP